MSKAFTAPTGRLVAGDPFTPQPVKDDKTGVQKVGKDGQPLVEYVVLVAYAKTDPLFHPFYSMLKAEDRAAWPQFHGADGNVLPGVKFADKIYDGDGYDTKGKHRADKEGWAGHWIVKYGSSFAPQVVSHDGRQWVPVTDPKALKRGYYVQVQGSTQSNQSSQSPGMYRNLNMVALVAYGPEIMVGADPNEVFGAPPTQLPPGASAVPLAVAAPLPPTDGGASPPVAPTAPPIVPTTPAPAPPPLPSTTTISPSNVKTTVAGCPWTYEQLIAAGHTDDTMRAAGYLA